MTRRLVRTVSPSSICLPRDPVVATELEQPGVCLPEQRGVDQIAFVLVVVVRVADQQVVPDLDLLEVLGGRRRGVPDINLLGKLSPLGRGHVGNRLDIPQEVANALPLGDQVRHPLASSLTEPQTAGAGVQP